jgi:hypothetical protein
MHQPLHCGFADDRGGNTVKVIYSGKRINLHEFWDQQLILTKAGSLPGLLAQTEPELERINENQWNPAEVNAWTTESHGLAGSMAYPATPEISDTFEEESWLLVRQRLPIGAMRLTQILNATLGEGKVILDRQGLVRKNGRRRSEILATQIRYARRGDCAWHTGEMLNASVPVNWPSTRPVSRVARNRD